MSHQAIIKIIFIWHCIAEKKSKNEAAISLKKHRHTRYRSLSSLVHSLADVNHTHTHTHTHTAILAHTHTLLVTLCLVMKVGMKRPPIIDRMGTLFYRNRSLLH